MRLIILMLFLLTSFQTHALTIDGSFPTLKDDELRTQRICINELMLFSEHNTTLIVRQTIQTLLITNSPCNVLAVIKDSK